jgi:hypothetical protein
MARDRAKYDPLESAKLGTDAPPAAKAAQGRREPDDLDEDEASPSEAPARRPRYRVVKAKRVSIRGNVCDFKEDRILDSAGYDIESLKAQGLSLELVEE